MIFGRIPGNISSGEFHGKILGENSGRRILGTDFGDNFWGNFRDTSGDNHGDNSGEIFRDSRGQFWGQSQGQFLETFSGLLNLVGQLCGQFHGQLFSMFKLETPYLAREI